MVSPVRTPTALPVRSSPTGVAHPSVSTAAPGRFVIENCLVCGSHFEQKGKEAHCSACLEWAELAEHREAMARSVAGSRGGRL